MHPRVIWKGVVAALAALVLNVAPGMAQDAPIRIPTEFKQGDAPAPPQDAPPAWPAALDDQRVKLSTQPTPVAIDQQFILLPYRQGVSALAIPANNACSAAQAIAGVGTWAFDTSMATTDGRAHPACNFFGAQQIERDIWYRWTAAITARVVIDTCTGTSIDTKIALYSNGACTPTDALLISCSDDACSLQSRVTLDANAGSQYLIRVGNSPGTQGGTGTLRVAYQAGSGICTQPNVNCQPKSLSDAYLATGVVIQDDFTPTTSGTVNSLCFWGSYYNGINDCQSGTADAFTIRYWVDDFGFPSQLPLATFAPGQYTLTGPVPTGVNIAGDFPEYAYTLTHAPVNVLAGTCYWVEIRNNLTGGCNWYWERGSNGNNFCFIDGVGAPADMALCVSRQIDPSTECQVTFAPSNDTCANAEFAICSGTYEVDNRFATTSASDPAFTCRFDGAAQGVGTLWYRFRASATTARISLCESTPLTDTLVAVYSGSSCNNLVQIACNDDYCGQRSQICVSNLTVNQFYYVQVASRSESARGIYQLNIRCPCPAAPANDTCAGAPLLTFTSGNTTGASGFTIDATIDTDVPACDFTALSSPSVWYRVVGEGKTLEASLCGASFDTKLTVYCGSCTGLVCVTNNDDSTICPPRSFATWCGEAGRTYYILVHGFNGTVGPFTLNLNRLTTSCSSPPACGMCNLTCAPGTVPENEPCGGADNNGGCNVAADLVQTIQCGQTVCGTASSANGVRDTDWYQFTLTQPSLITWSVQSEAPVELFLLNNLCFPSQQIYATATNTRCTTAQATASLAAGTYRAFVAQVGDAYPCGSGSNDYLATLTCVPLGACCSATGCQVTTQAACTTSMGTFRGPGSICPLTYPVTTCAAAFEDIRSNGTNLNLAADAGVSVPIGFSFRYFGLDYDSVGVSANGYLTFSAAYDGIANTAFPSALVPNAMIAPFWDDLAPENGGSVRLRLLGAAPSRRLVVQWTDVPRFGGPSAPSTFQAVLFEGTNCIEFRYSAVTDPGSANVGLENQSGNIGTNVTTGVVPGACLKFCPTLSPQGCTASCQGDADGNGRVNFADLTAVLLNYSGVPPLGDADGNGVVNFADLTNVLLNFNNVCGGIGP